MRGKVRSGKKKRGGCRGRRWEEMMRGEEEEMRGEAEEEKGGEEYHRRAKGRETESESEVNAKREAAMQWNGK